ncbi:MAG: serine hydrolase [Hyphomonadaceae bacterium]
MSFKFTGEPAGHLAGNFAGRFVGRFAGGGVAAIVAALSLVGCAHDTTAASPAVEAAPAAVASAAPAETAAALPSDTALARARVLFWSRDERIKNYPDMEKLFPANTIHADGKSTPMPRADQALEVSFPFDGETWTIDDYMTKNETAGLLVMKDGEIVLERYGFDQTPDKRWTSFSVAKSFSSTLVGAAIKDGYIKSVDDPLTDYLPKLKGTAYEGVSVKQMLQMVSGVKWNEDYEDPKSDVALFSLEPTANGSDPVVSYMARLPREAEPGAKWVYKTGETNLVGSLVRAATHKTLSQYLTEKVWTPLGMEHDAIWLIDDSGGEVAGCCLSATLRDYARFAEFFMEGAKIDGVSIVPDTWIHDATTSTKVASEAMGGTGGYGYQWWTTPGPQYRASGIFGQGIWINPEKKLIVVTQSAWPGATDRKSAQARQALIDAIEAHYKS